MPHMPRRGPHIDHLITFTNETVDPPRPVLGKRIQLHPTTRWPATTWLVITVTMARNLIDIPENIITTRNSEALLHFLASHPQWNHAIDQALYKVGYQIHYPKPPKGAP